MSRIANAVAVLLCLLLGPGPPWQLVVTAAARDTARRPAGVSAGRILVEPAAAHRPSGVQLRVLLLGPAMPPIMGKRHGTLAKVHGRRRAKRTKSAG